MILPHVTPKVSSIAMTGASGRLASLAARHFSLRGHPVSLYSHSAATGCQPLHALLHEEEMAQADILFHFAWSTLPATSEQNSGAEQNCDLPLLNSLLATLARLPEKSRPLFVFFSSGGTVYGNAPGRPSIETDACHPIGAYGRAKLAAENLIQACVASHGLRSIVLRVSNPYGYDLPASRPQGIISHALRCALTGEELTLWGDGSARKDYLFHTDFMSALDAVVDGKLTGLYNLGFGQSYTVSEILRTVENLSSRKLRIKHATAPSWDVHESVISPAKFIAATSWQPTTTLSSGITRMLERNVG